MKFYQWLLFMLFLNSMIITACANNTGYSDSGEAENPENIYSESVTKNETTPPATGRLTVRLVGANDYAGKTAGYTVYTSESDTRGCATGRFIINTNGTGESMAAVSASGDVSSSPRVFTNGQTTQVRLTLDMNGNFARDFIPDSNDWLSDDISVIIEGDTLLIISNESLKSISAGLNDNQLYQLRRLSEKYNQLTATGLSSQISAAMEAVKQDPSLIVDATKREQFLNQDPEIAAAYLCTTISPYLYLSAYQMLYPENVVGLPEEFWEYYIDVVNANYVLLGVTTGAFCYAYENEKMITDYVYENKQDVWQLSRYEYLSDDKLISEMMEREAEILLFREGPAGSGGVHSFIVARHNNGNYYMIDTWATQYTGQTIDKRFGANQPRYLYYIRNYIH